MRRIGAVLAAVLALAGACGFPRDTGSTLADVRDGVLRIGVTENAPWVSVPDEGPPAGAEVELANRLAARLHARVEWYPGSESELMAALKDRVLDVVIGGLDDAAPWTELAALTRPYVGMRSVVAAPAGVTVPDDLSGVEVAVRGGTADVAALTAAGATVRAVAEVTGDERIPVAADEWQLGELGLTASKHELDARNHVWAVPPGENAWQSEVERFLLDLSHDEVTALLVAADRAEAAA